MFNFLLLQPHISSLWGKYLRLPPLLELSSLKVLTIFSCLFVNSTYAEFNPEVLSQSTVRILIKNDQGVIGVATGFVWKDPTQIVTSLHVMTNDPSGKIIIEFGKKRRLATVKSVLPYADLVLLEVKRPIKEWRPLTSFDPIKPKYKSQVSALGFNRGSLGMSTRELIKGYAKPEVLQQFLPESALAALAISKMPDIKLPIYYLDGSLLPGYSGAPIVNNKGQLIGVGNGGLENGSANVSWVIPALHLVELENSNKDKLPADLDEIAKIFTLDKIQPKIVRTVMNLSPETSHKMSGLNWLNSFLHGFISQAHAGPTKLSDLEEFSPIVKVNYQQFNFVKVKTRSYRQMLSTSGAPKNMEHVFTLFNKFFHGYKVDHSAFLFDIYEDGNTGLNLVVPHGVQLTVDDGYLLAQGNMFCRTCAYEIQYHARIVNENTVQAIKGNPREFLNNVSEQHWQDLNEEGDYGEYSDFRSIEDFGADRYILRAAFSDFSEPFKQEFELNYFTAATNKRAWFQAQGILNRFDEEFLNQIKTYRGTNCKLPSSSMTKSSLCNDINTILKVMLSVHLTSFSNKFFTIK